MVASKMRSILPYPILFLALPAAYPTRPPLDRPNFILLFMDDLGYGDLGFTGHPTTNTPNLDKLAWSGKILTSWYSGCSACTGSRSALMTGRQWPRTGLPDVLGPADNIGLPLNETTIAEHLKHAGYATGIVGKWHLGQRKIYSPGNRGFDYYLGIPYSDDQGDGVASPCNGESEQEINSNTSNKKKNIDPASLYLPLMYQELNKTTILEQPVDFTTLAEKYNQFAVKYIHQHKSKPFFLYVPFSHVHTTSKYLPESQYASCAFQNTTRRGKFGDVLAESDWIVGNIVKTLIELDLEENTLILFTSDNGPWLSRGLGAGSEGVFTGRYAGYYDTGKHTTWEGGIRMPAFAYWKGQILANSRSSEVVSSLDVFPTFSSLAGIPLPTDRVFDGRDMASVLAGGRSKHDFLFFYGTCHTNEPYYTVTAARHGKYKAHWCTAPGLYTGENITMIKTYTTYPLLFDVDKDPSESEPISEGALPTNPMDQAAMERIMKAYVMEKATFAFGKVVPFPDGPGEGPNQYGVCCDRDRDCNCGQNYENIGILNIGTKLHHDRYHKILGEEDPLPTDTWL